jgi:hypothetical protein
MSISGSSDWVELARRTSDDLEVVLLWSRSSNRVKVAVADERLCHHLDFDVARADALSAFYHPFAQAAAHLANGGSHSGDDVASGSLREGDGQGFRQVYGRAEAAAPRAAGVGDAGEPRAA